MEDFNIEAKLNGLATAARYKGEWSIEAKEYKDEIINHIAEHVEGLQIKIANLEAQVEWLSWHYPYLGQLPTEEQLSEQNSGFILIHTLDKEYITWVYYVPSRNVFEAADGNTWTPEEVHEWRFIE